MGFNSAFKGLIEGR